MYRIKDELINLRTVKRIETSVKNFGGGDVDYALHFFFLDDLEMYTIYFDKESEMKAEFERLHKQSIVL